MTTIIVLAVVMLALIAGVIWLGVSDNEPRE